MSSAAIQVSNLHKSYKMGRVDLHVLKGVSFSINKGEFAAIVGASGSGKSTLLHLAGLLDRPDKGQVHLHGQDVEKISFRKRNQMRCEDIGFVFQFYHLLPELNVLENTLLPSKVDTSTLGWLVKKNSLRKKAAELLERLGMSERIKHKPKELSGGERQRVAIARALMNEPDILLADEPTGNLDSKTGRQIMKVLQGFNRDSRQTILMVTHDTTLAQETDRTLHLRDGQLTD